LRLPDPGDVRIRLLPPLTKPIEFRGAVQAPGALSPAAGLKLSTLVKLARATDSAELGALELFAYDGTLQVIDFEGGEDPELKSGDVVVFPISRRSSSVNVLGGVARPSAVPYRPGLTLREALKLAGGMDVHADAKRVVIQRQGTAFATIDLAGTDDPLLQRGDTIQVPRILDAQYVTVAGQVQKPNLIGIRDGMTLEDILKAAGGLVEPAAIDRIIVKRGGGVGGRIKVDLRKQAGFLLKSGDIVEVPAGVVGAKPDLGLPKTGFPIPP